jgi:hypothetical protein
VANGEWPVVNGGWKFPGSSFVNRYSAPAKTGSKTNNKGS